MKYAAKTIVLRFDSLQEIAKKKAFCLIKERSETNGKMFKNI